MDSAEIRPAPACVAIVDDDPRIRTLLEDELIEHGLTPHLCSGGLELLQLIQSRQVDVVMLDVSMPEMSGLDCLERLREAGFAGQVLMITAVEDGGTRRAALEAGAQEYVLKTDLFEQLPGLLQRYLRIDLSTS
jgi:DNA-binding response OmpR family regulator